MESISLSPKKNTVLFSLESKRASFFETFGGPYPSPNMSRLAAQGVQFNNMISAAPSTGMSLTSVLEGRFPHKSDVGTYDNSGAKSPNNLFTLQKNEGKRCYFVWAESLFEPYKSKIYDGPHTEYVGLPDEEYRSTNIAKKVVELANASDEPFFILAHNSCHKGCDIDEKPKWRNSFERYIFEDDLAIGILLDNLDLENTRLIVYADHGLLMGEHGNLWWYAFSLYQQCIHVPCIVSDDTPRLSTEPHSLIELHNAVKNNEIIQEPDIISDSMFALQPHRITALRRGHWKYVAHYSWETALAGKPEELYDLIADPGENRNLLHDVARNPLRVSWNTQDVARNWPRYGYDCDELNDVLVSMRETVAKIWVDDFTEDLLHVSPAMGEKAKRLLENQPPRHQMHMVGKLAKQFGGDSLRYEEWDREEHEFPGVPVSHPLHPERQEESFLLPIQHSGILLGK